MTCLRTRRGLPSSCRWRPRRGRRKRRRRRRFPPRRAVHARPPPGEALPCRVAAAPTPQAAARKRQGVRLVGARASSSTPGSILRRAGCGARDGGERAFARRRSTSPPLLAPTQRLAPAWAPRLSSPRAQPARRTPAGRTTRCAWRHTWPRRAARGCSRAGSCRAPRPGTSPKWSSRRRGGVPPSMRTRPQWWRGSRHTVEEGAASRTWPPPSQQPPTATRRAGSGRRAPAPAAWTARRSAARAESVRRCREAEGRCHGGPTPLAPQTRWARTRNMRQTGARGLACASCRLCATRLPRWTWTPSSPCVPSAHCATHAAHRRLSPAP